jgi:hypothetical protein
MPYRAMVLVAAIAVICTSLQILVPTAGLAGAPLKSVDVKLGKNPGGSPAARTGGAGVTTVKSSKSNTSDRMGGGGTGKPKALNEPPRGGGRDNDPPRGGQGLDLPGRR